MSSILNEIQQLYIIVSSVTVCTPDCRCLRCTRRLYIISAIVSIQVQVGLFFVPIQSFVYMHTLHIHNNFGRTGKQKKHGLSTCMSIHIYVQLRASEQKPLFNRYYDNVCSDSYDTGVSFYGYLCKCYGYPLSQYPDCSFIYIFMHTEVN